LIRFLYSRGFDDDLLLRLFEEYAQKDVLLPEEEGFADIALRKNLSLLHATFLFLRGEKAQALALLRRHVKAHGPDSVHSFLPAALLAHEHGITNDLIEEAAFVYEHMLAAREQKAFENFIRGKSIAVVGNGPQETGSGNGGRIDGHDIVLRINSAAVGQAYASDYGRKTNVWCRNIMKPYTFDLFPEVPFLLLTNNCERFRFPKGLTQNLVKTIRRDKRVLVAPARSAILDIYRPFDFAWFSTGFQVAAFLHSLRESCCISFGREDIFGMSFTREGKEEPFALDHLYYYEADRMIAGAYADHSLPRERDACARLFGMERTPET
ncbi:MAG: glycosyltransferase family 29 protein, partial [Desulfovibrio sp.]|jgi:hypothetical protein|nr:glycosyltransferase family 29 protein [Desulfovibrio sp.]